MVKGFSKMYNLLFFVEFFFEKIFNIKLDFAKKKSSIFANLQFFAYSKSRVQELSKDVSFVIFGHQTWDLEPILVFKYPSRDRVKDSWCNKQSLSWH